MKASEVAIRVGEVTLGGELSVPEGARGLVIFAHGSGSSRHSPRNQFVARVLREAGLGTLLFDLMTVKEEQAELQTRHLRFNIPFLTMRLISVTLWAIAQPSFAKSRIGYFGASTGAAAALMGAADSRGIIRAVVSRGGRPDLAGDYLDAVHAPTLLIVGGNDTPVIPLNEQAFARLRCEKEMKVVPGASHLFEEAGALETVAETAGAWFARHLGS